MNARSAKAALLAKRGAIAAFLEGRQSASSTSLSRSYGLSIDQVRSILRTQGVRDDG